MIRVLTDNNFITCEKCNSLLGYEEKDAWISSDKGCNVLSMEDFTYVKKFIGCPVCFNRVIISEEKKCEKEKENITKKD